MVRLTADLILQSPQFFNAVRERELDLRGNKIAVIENLGATEDLYDCIDLSDNEIVKLEGFPALRRLSTLLLNSNRITRVSKTMGAHLPRLHTLILTNNRIANLADLDALASLAGSLRCLSLVDCLVSKKPKYRPYTIHLLPNLKLLDFRKVKQKERTDASRLFSLDSSALIAAKRASANTFVPGEALEGAAGAAAAAGDGTAVSAGGVEGDVSATAGVEGEAVKRGPTADQITAIKAAIATAQTLEEVARLEKALQSGQLPAENADAGADSKEAETDKSSQPMEQG